jgi:hypothetical protein
VSGRRFRLVSLSPYANEVELPAGSVGTLMHRVADDSDIWVVLFGHYSVKVRERHFEIPSLLERIAREVEDAEGAD